MHVHTSQHLTCWLKVVKNSWDEDLWTSVPESTCQHHIRYQVRDRTVTSQNSPAPQDTGYAPWAAIAAMVTGTGTNSSCYVNEGSRVIILWQASRCDGVNGNKRRQETRNVIILFHDRMIFKIIWHLFGNYCSTKMQFNLNFDWREDTCQYNKYEIYDVWWYWPLFL